MREPPPPPVSQLAVWSLRLALLALFFGLAAVAGAQLRRLSADETLVLLGAGFALGAVAVVLGGAALVAIWNDGLRGLTAAVGGLALSLLWLAYPAYGLIAVVGHPPINDISTDVETPLTFSIDNTAVEARGGYKPPAYQTAFAAEQRTAYPAVQPLVIDVESADAFNIVLQAMGNLGLKVTEQRSPEESRTRTGIVEAVEVSRLLRFTDDVAVRIRAVSDSETRIDVRSRSRTGRHDLGTNAARVMRIIEELTRLASAQE